MLDKEGFLKFLKKTGKSQRAAHAAVARVEEFERYLKTEAGGKEVEEAEPKDLERFMSWLERDEDMAAKRYLLGIHYFCEYVSNEAMSDLASYEWNQRVADSAPPFRLRGFRGINPQYLRKLEEAGIRNVKKMLDVGRTQAARRELSTRTGIPLDAVLELVKLSDLARIQGLKGIRARLYCDAGVDTVEKLARWKPEDLRNKLTRFVEKTKFDGIAPLPKEARNAVEMAKRLPKIVQY